MSINVFILNLECFGLKVLFLINSLNFGEQSFIIFNKNRGVGMSKSTPIFYRLGHCLKLNKFSNFFTSIKY